MANSFGVPSELEPDALEDALKNARTRGEELAKINDDEFSDEQLEEFEAVAQFINDANTVKAEREQAAAEKAQKIEALRSTVTASDDEDDEEEEAPAEDAPSEEAPAEEIPVEEAPVIAEEPTEPAPDEEEEEEEKFSTEKTTEEAPAPVAAAAEEEAPEAEATSESLASEATTDTEEEDADVADSTKASLAAAAKNAPTPEAPDAPAEGKYSLTAAANVQGVQAGKKYSTLGEASEAIASAIKALPTGGKGRTRIPALQFSVKGQHAQEGRGDDTELLLAAGSEKNLEGGSLTASGGWARPSEQLLDFCQIETAEGLVDLPSITVYNSGVNYTKGPTFEDVLNSDVGFWDWTEAQAEAGTEEKTALEPDVPGFHDVRLDAVGVMVEAGILTRHGWPQLVERYASLAMLAHQVKVHKKIISKVREYTGEAVDVAGGYGNAIDVLNILGVVIAGERQRYSMGQRQTLEVWLPVWVKNVLRADLANRNGVDLLDVNDSRINAWFTNLGARVQYLEHYQDLEYTNGIAQSYPAELDVIAYPAGTYVKGEEDVLKLDTLYDSVNLRKNKYTHLFMEQGILVANPCFEGRRFKFPVNINGRTAAADIIANFGA